jgi:hypothetical protein
MPLLFLMGDADNWNPAAPCREMLAWAGSGAPIEAHFYPDAHHTFDHPNLPLQVVSSIKLPPDGHSPTSGTNPSARADAIVKVKAFLASRLGPASIVDVKPAPQRIEKKDPSPLSSTPIGGSSRRVALVIGNAKYPDADPPIVEPSKHARSFAEDLRRSGYEVELAENLTRQGLLRSINQFKAKITPGSIALVFFSGYGIQTNRQTYILPVDAQIWAEKDVNRDGIELESLLADLHEKGATGKLAIVDASRRNPFERRFRRTAAGLAPVTLPPETLVIYAAAPGQVTKDESGVFISELAKEIRAPSTTAEEAFIRTRVGVSNLTKGQQVPWISSSLTGPLSFAQAGK